MRQKGNQTQEVRKKMNRKTFKIRNSKSTKRLKATTTKKTQNHQNMKKMTMKRQNETQTLRMNTNEQKWEYFILLYMFVYHLYTY